MANGLCEEETMDEAITCHRCGHANPSQNRFCGCCGASLGEDVVVENLPSRGESWLLPDLKVPHAIAKATGSKTLATLSRVGKPLALGTLALATEVGLAWLSHRAIRGKPILPITSSPPEERPALQGGPLQLEIYEEVLLFSWEGIHPGRHVTRRSETRLSRTSAP